MRPVVPSITALLAGAAALVGACGAASEPSRDHATGTAATAAAGAAREHRRAPAVCGRLRAVATGTLQAPELTELSGLALSPDQPGVLWAHNDSGDRPRVFALAPDGRALAVLDVPGAEAVDWEDLAIGPASAGARPRALYLADTGDNASSRAGIDVYRVPEPRLPATGVTAPATRLRLRYPDGAHDAETLLVEPRTGELAIVTKRFDGASRVYSATPAAVARAAAGAVVTLRRGALLPLGTGGLATAGDVSANRRIVVVRTYTALVAWRKAPGATLAATLRRRPCRGVVPLAGEGQGESLALTRSGRAFFTAPEGAGATIRRYAAR
ncbi:MAG TPA: hypothetical protein VFT50_18255 [Baekduia sp.]|nr:hypothetical protein [Baekduia sp.]